MSNWNKVRLGEVCDTISATYKKGSKSIVLINTSDVLSGKVLNHKKEPNKNLKGQFKKTFQRDDILYSEIRPQNRRFAFIDFEPTDYIASTKLMVLRCRQCILPKYFFHVLSSDEIIQNLQALAETRSGTFPQITFSELSTIEIQLPPLEEQQRIARILGALDDKIECNNRINWNLEEQAAVLFRRWFVDFEFPDSDGKPYRTSGGKMQDSSLGKIPQGWKVGKFTDIIDILGGGTPNTGTNDYWGGQIQFFTPKDAKDNLYSISTEKYITDKGLDKCNSKLYSEETVFITARGTVGKIAIAGCDMAMNQSCYALVGKNSIGQYFVYHITKETVSLLRNKASGAVFDAITTRDFESELVIIPAEKLSYEFNDTVKSFMKLILSNTVEKRILLTLRDTLLPKLMNNEKKV